MAKHIRIPLAGISLSLVALAAAAQSSNAQAAQTRDYHIESQSLPAAVNDWADQAGMQVMWSAQMPGAQREAPEVAGRFSAPAALEQVLQGSGLTFAFLDEQTVAIRLASAAGQSASSPAAGESEVRSPFPSQGEGTGEDLKRGEGRGEDSKQSVRGADSAAASKAETISEVIVTGTHLRRAQAVSPHLTISQDEIEKAGFTSVQSVMESLPQNFAEISPGGRFAVEGGSTLATSNNERVSSIDLRGLGAQSTLTLLNGMRWAGSVGGRVFDVSAIPISMIERIDVVTGGHSAVYGGDAVGGVVNLLTRRDFDGLETQLSYGAAREGGERLRVSQLGGMRFDNGGFAIGYEYGHEQPLDLADVGLLSLQPSPGNGDVTQLSLQAQAKSSRHSGFLSGHYDMNESLRVFGDVLYSHKSFQDDQRTLRPGASTESFTSNHRPADLYGLTVGARVSLGSNWMLNVNAGASETDSRLSSNAFTDDGGFTSQQEQVFHDRATVSTLSAVIDGSLPKLLGIAPQLAFGLEGREERFTGRLAIDDVPQAPNSGHRQIYSVFGELALPLITDGRLAGLRNLEATIAGRYDDYSDFGSTLNPQFAVMLEPVPGVRLTGSISRSFRAPALVDLADATFAAIFEVEDPQSGSGVAPALIWSGDNPKLGPEKSKGWDIGLRFEPSSFPQLAVSLSYFSIEYTNRIETPAVNFEDQLLALVNEGRYPGLIARGPDAAYLGEIIERANASQGFFNFTGQDFADCPGAGSCNPTASDLLTAMPNVVVFDNRTNNIAIDKVRGLDLQLSGVVEASKGAIEYGLNASYTLDHKRFVTATSPSFQLLNEPGKPVDLRLRGNLGWTSDAYGVYAFLNYVDRYTNPYSTPARRIGSFTTVDLTLRYDSSVASDGGLLHGNRITLSVANMFDKAPPRYDSAVIGLLYDSTNASPFGRYITLGLTRKW